jgi:hypothetical protein
MRSLLLFVVLLASCTASIKDEGSAVVAAKQPITPLGNNTWAAQDAEAVNRSVQIGRTVAERLNNYTHR